MKTPWIAEPTPIPSGFETDRLRLRKLTIHDAVKDYDAVVKSRARALPFMLDAHRKMWEPDVGVNRFVSRTR